VKLAVEGEFDVIVHGCNCFCKMGAGVAKAIKNAFPEAADADTATLRGDRRKLGTISSVRVRRGEHAIVIVNGYTQFEWRGAGRLVDYNAVRSVMKAVKNGYPGLRIGYPRIGAGLGQGNWEVIEKIIREELGGEDHTLVEFSA
jgi:O-acetyl-ADP-ribose deacetylase (regulator of RNase III)